MTQKSVDADLAGDHWEGHSPKFNQYLLTAYECRGVVTNHHPPSATKS